MLEKLIQNQKIILVCGSGGVGKTTTAAALGLKAAMMGKKVIVLTIDPAKRLASSLGLESLASEPKKIQPKLLKEKVGEVKGEFYAMMLDTKSTFDSLVEKYAPSKEVVHKILNNKIYQQLSALIVGSQEYMAMEKLFEFSQHSDFDLIVIDTPPTIHAIDFLNAPEKMVSAISNSMMHLLLKPAMKMGKSGLKLIDKGAQMVLKIFDRIIGFAFLQEISEMLISFQSMLGGFESRAKDVKEILGKESTSFVLVCACEDKSMMEANLFQKTLDDMNLSLDAVLLNRVHPYFEKSRNQMEMDSKKLQEKMGEKLTEKMMTVFNHYQKTALIEKKFSEQLKNIKSKYYLEIPLFETDVHDLSGLNLIGNYL